MNEHNPAPESVTLRRVKEIHEGNGKNRVGPEIKFPGERQPPSRFSRMFTARGRL